AIFPRRPAIVDHRHGAAGFKTRREGEILAGEPGVAARDSHAHHAFVLPVENELGPSRFLRRDRNGHDVFAHRSLCRFGCPLSEHEGCQSEQNRQRLRRDALSCVELSLHSWLCVGARHWDCRLSRAHFVDRGEHCSFCRALAVDWLAADETRFPATRENRILKLTWQGASLRARRAYFTEWISPPPEPRPRAGRRLQISIR